MTKLSFDQVGMGAIVCVWSPHGTVRLVTARPAGRASGRPSARQASGWPVLRTPRWMLAGGALLVVLVTLAAIPHHPSTAERATDLRSLVSELSVDVRSCAGGVTDSLIALHTIQSGTSHDVSTAVGIADKAAENCSPANSMETEALVQVQVPESLASFHLDRAVTSVSRWAAADATVVCADIAAVITSDTAAGRGRLLADQATLDAERATFDRLIGTASAALSAHVSPPALPS